MSKPQMLAGLRYVRLRGRRALYRVSAIIFRCLVSSTLVFAFSLDKFVHQGDAASDRVPSSRLSYRHIPRRTG